MNPYSDESFLMSNFHLKQNLLLHCVSFYLTQCVEYVFRLTIDFRPMGAQECAATLWERRVSTIAFIYLCACVRVLAYPKPSSCSCSCSRVRNLHSPVYIASKHMFCLPAYPWVYLPILISVIMCRVNLPSHPFTLLPGSPPPGHLIITQSFLAHELFIHQSHLFIFPLSTNQSSRPLPLPFTLLPSFNFILVILHTSL